MKERKGRLHFKRVRTKSCEVSEKRIGLVFLRGHFRNIGRDFTRGNDQKNNWPVSNITRGTTPLLSCKGILYIQVFIKLDHFDDDDENWDFFFSGPYMNE